MSRHTRGMTLMELLVASIVGTFMMLAMTSVDLTRFMIQLDIRNRMGIGSSETMAGLAGVRLSKDLERADRVNLINSDPDVIQLRMPIMTDPPCTVPGINPPGNCFGNSANFRWSEYRLSGSMLQYFEDVGAGGAACPPSMPLAGDIAALNFEYEPRAKPPPGPGDVAMAPNDNNAVQYRIDWADAAGRTHSFLGEVTSRAISYTDLTTTATNSGLGLLLGGGVPPQCT